MPIIPPWTPPTGNSWTALELYTRISQAAPLTFGEGDQNKVSVEDAVNWIGNKIFEILNQINSGYSTGDIKVSFYPTAQQGWILLDGRTIGSAGSGSVLTGVTYQPLFDILWTYALNSDLQNSAGSSTTKGASAAADWAANKRLILPDARGRVLVGAGQGTGLTNRLIMSRFGAEGGSVNHFHTINSTSGSALGSYTPSGAITINSTSISYTPQGNVTVDAYSGNVNPTGTITINQANLTPTPTGTVTVNITNGAVAGTGVEYVDGASCLPARDGGTHPTEQVIDCASNLSVDISEIANNLTTNVTVDAATFTGDVMNLDHTHTGSFTGTPVSINHGHSASFSGTLANLSHAHTGSFLGNSVDLTHSHNISANTDIIPIPYSSMQPSLASYIYIKL